MQTTTADHLLDREAFDVWYATWIDAHPSYRLVEEYVKPAMAVAFFSGSLYAINRTESVITPLLDQLDKLKDAIEEYDNGT